MSRVGVSGALVQVLVRVSALAICPAFLVSGHVAQRESEVDMLQPVPHVTPPIRGLHGVIVARTQDCDTRLDFAHVFERSWLERLRFEGIVLLDAHDDAAMTPARRVFPGLRVLPHNPGYELLLDVTGRSLSPVLFLYTPERILRMALQAPMTVQGADRLVSWLVSPLSQ